MYFRNIFRHFWMWLIAYFVHYTSIHWNHEIYLNVCDGLDFGSQEMVISIERIMNMMNVRTMIVISSDFCFRNDLNAIWMAGPNFSDVCNSTAVECCNTIDLIVHYQILRGMLLLGCQHVEPVRCFDQICMLNLSLIIVYIPVRATVNISSIIFLQFSFGMCYFLVVLFFFLFCSILCSLL